LKKRGRGRFAVAVAIAFRRSGFNRELLLVDDSRIKSSRLKPLLRKAALRNAALTKAARVAPFVRTRAPNIRPSLALHAPAAQLGIAVG